MILLIGKRRLRQKTRTHDVLLEETIRRRHKRKVSAGFTLVELLLVVVIIGVLTSVSIPRFKKTYSSLRLNNTASDIVYFMRYARSRSVIERKQHKLQFDSLKTRYWLQRESEDAESGKFERVPNKFGRVATVPDGILVECDADSIMFYPDGSIDNLALYITNENNNVYTILTNGRTGYVQMFDYKIQ